MNARRQGYESSAPATRLRGGMAVADGLVMAKQFRVWWIPQVPGPQFHVWVVNPDQGRLVLNTLSRYDRFQLENNIKPDHSNAGGLEVIEGGEWVEWVGDDGNDIWGEPA